MKHTKWGWSDEGNDGPTTSTCETLKPENISPGVGLSGSPLAKS